MRPSVPATSRRVGTRRHRLAASSTIRSSMNGDKSSTREGLAVNVLHSRCSCLGPSLPA
jgi:hypothetical protein